MADRVTFSELIAHKPLVFAWVWEMVCLAAGIYVITTGGNELLFIALAFMGVIPFAVVMLMFLQARKRGAVAAKPRSIVE
ncbi:MAG: hypothetical protein Q7T61_03955 [Caulobacter sp.]|nr:hypothetical protein [Caulobacter sp.]